jgi:hypothetical protein
MLPIREDHPLKQLFTGLVEHAFQAALGLCDPALAVYISDLLVEFVHVDNMALGGVAAGRPVGELAELVCKWETLGDMPGEKRQRYIHRRIGDYTLFWSGIYPEGVRRTRGLFGGDYMSDYMTFGKHSYAIASELTPAGEQPPPILLRRLSEDFEFCVQGLGIVRHELEQTNPPPGHTGDLIY